MSRTPLEHMPEGIQSFGHMPLDYVTAYGPTSELPTTESICNTLHTFNCEFLQGPKVGMRAVASSVEENLK